MLPEYCDVKQDQKWTRARFLVLMPEAGISGNYLNYKAFILMPADGLKGL
jgi:hypothetical protein